MINPNYTQMPFIHFLQEIEDGILVSPKELPSDYCSQGGAFYVPLNDKDQLFDSYLIEYTHYLGKGKFTKNIYGNHIFLAYANKYHKNLFLRFVKGNQNCFPDYSSKMPLIKNSDFFKRKGELGKFHYGGNLKHPDFQRSFMQLKTCKENQLEDLLINAKISLIGCNPNTNYKESTK